jgi:hypothetical protein
MQISDRPGLNGEKIAKYTAKQKWHLEWQPALNYKTYGRHFGLCKKKDD